MKEILHCRKCDSTKMKRTVLKDDPDRVQVDCAKCGTFRRFEKRVPVVYVGTYRGWKFMEVPAEYLEDVVKRTPQTKQYRRFQRFVATELERRKRISPDRG